MPKSKISIFIYGIAILLACCFQETAAASSKFLNPFDLGICHFSKMINGKDFQIDLQRTEDLEKNIVLMTIKNNSNDTKFLHTGIPKDATLCSAFRMNIDSLPQICLILQSDAWEQEEIRLEPLTTLNVMVVFAQIRRNQHFESFLINARTQEKTTVPLFDDQWKP
jgi:hypothetical protein